MEGQASDIEIHARDILRMKARINEILSLHTGQPVEKVERDTDRDNIFEAEAAKRYGLIDTVINRRDGQTT
jgi:ATP-dependent Clp protease protease subunit